MGALGIAFDTIIVGALALPWLVLAVDLFLPKEESRISSPAELQALESYAPPTEPQASGARHGLRGQEQYTPTTPTIRTECVNPRTALLRMTARTMRSERTIGNVT